MICPQSLASVPTTVHRIQAKMKPRMHMALVKLWTQLLYLRLPTQLCFSIILHEWSMENQEIDEER
jgi:hypothetical protein